MEQPPDLLLALAPAPVDNPTTDADGGIVADKPETLTDLVSDRVGKGRPMTFDQFEEKAIDPKSQHRVSRGVLFKIAHGEPIMLSPEVVGGVAAGLGIDPQRAALAAARQYAGLVQARQVFEGELREEAAATVVSRGAAEPEGERNRAHVARIEQEEFGGR